jgi:uncharacterized protein involved in outer membrane biogenesis
MKYIKWIVLGLVVVIVLVVGIVWMNINGIVRRTVETQATNSLDLQTTVGGANVSLFGGSVGLSELRVASPKGFDAPQMFALDGVKVDVSLGQLRSDPIGIQQIRIDNPQLVVEQADGKFNFKVLMDQQSKQPPDSGNPGDGKRDETEPIRLIVHDLVVNEAKVSLRPGIPGLAQQIDVPIPSFQLKDIGTSEGNKNGVAIKEVVMLLVTTLAQKASESGSLPAEVKQLLALNVDQVKQQVQAELNKQIGKITSELEKKLPGDIGKDAGKALEKGVGDLLGGNRKKEEKP